MTLQPLQFQGTRSRVITKVEILILHPEAGWTAPEFQSDSIREIIVPPYRIVYRVNHSRECVEVIRIWHGARGEPELPRSES